MHVRAAHPLEMTMLSAVLGGAQHVIIGAPPWSVETVWEGRLCSVRLRHALGGGTFLVPVLRRDGFSIPWGIEIAGKEEPPALYIAGDPAWLLGGAPEPTVAWHQTLKGHHQPAERYAAMVKGLMRLLYWQRLQDAQSVPGRRAFFRALRRAAVCHPVEEALSRPSAVETA